VLPLLSQAPDIPSDNWTDWLQLFDCFAGPANIPPHACQKAKSPLYHTVEKSMEKTTPNKANHYSVFVFHKIYVVVNISFPFMAPFTQVTYSAFRGTLSVAMRDSAV